MLLEHLSLFWKGRVGEGRVASVTLLQFRLKCVEAPLGVDCEVESLHAECVHKGVGRAYKSWGHACTSGRCGLVRFPDPPLELSSWSRNLTGCGHAGGGRKGGRVGGGRGGRRRI